MSKYFVEYLKKLVLKGNKNVFKMCGKLFSKQYYNKSVLNSYSVSQLVVRNKKYRIFL